MAMYKPIKQLFKPYDILGKFTFFIVVGILCCTVALSDRVCVGGIMDSLQAD